MHIIVKRALGHIKNGALPGKHHFFISFLTVHPDVKLPKHLKEKYPDEMTIVLQHQFEELKIDDAGFSVVLSFDNIKEKIVIPFAALIAFADPSVKFGLQFSHISEKQGDRESDSSGQPTNSRSSGEQDDPVQTKVQEKSGAKAGKKTSGKGADTKKNNKTSTKTTNVVDLEAFRKK